MDNKQTNDDDDDDDDNDNDDDNNNEKIMKTRPATQLPCAWAGAVLEKLTRASGQEPFAQKAQKQSQKR